MRNFLWCYYIWLIHLKPLKNVKKNAIFFELFWQMDFVYWKLKLISFLVDSVLSLMLSGKKDIYQSITKSFQKSHFIRAPVPYHKKAVNGAINYLGGGGGGEKVGHNDSVNYRPPPHPRHLSAICYFVSPGGGEFVRNPVPRGGAFFHFSRNSIVPFSVVNSKIVIGISIKKILRVVLLHHHLTLQYFSAYV